MATVRGVGWPGINHTITVGDDTYRLADNVAALSYQDGAGWTVEFHDQHAMFVEQLIVSGILVPHDPDAD